MFLAISGYYSSILDYLEQRVGERACNIVFKIPAQVQLQKVKDGRVVATAATAPRPFCNQSLQKLGCFGCCFFLCCLFSESFFLVCLFVCLFGIKSEKLYSVPWVGKEIKPLGKITHGQRHKPHAFQRQRHRPRTCQSMVNTLQIDGLARITGLSSSHRDSTIHPQPPNSVPPCLVWRIGFGRGERLT